MPFINPPPLICAFPFVSSRPGLSLYVPPLNARLHPCGTEGTDARGQMEGEMRRRQTQSRGGGGVVGKKRSGRGGFVGNWEMLDLLRARFRSQILHLSSCLAKKKKKKRKMTSNIVIVSSGSLREVLN